MMNLLMKIKFRYFFLFISILLVVSLIYTLLWGKLFPYSPVYLGFDKHELNNTIVYIQNGASFNEFKRIDTLTKPVEAFHSLRFLKKPKIFIFKDSISFMQRSLLKSRFGAYSSGTILVAPWSLKDDKAGIISLEIYLKHELSHVLIFNYKGYFTSVFYPRWLLEGIATYSTNLMGTSFYPDKKETYRLIRNGNFMPPGYFNTKKESNIKLNVKHKGTFCYSEFACIVDYLIKSYGKEKFIRFMKLLFTENDNNTAFNKVYSRNFDDVIADFKNHVYRSYNLSQNVTSNKFLPAR